MIIDILKLLKALLSALPFVLMCIVLAKLNIKKEMRYKQIFLPVLALLYCIAGVILLDKVSVWLLSGVYWLIENVSWLEFLDKINWASGAVFLVNFALALGFALIKWLLMPLLLPKPVPLVGKASSPFYFATDEDTRKGEDRRYLRSKFSDARKVIAAMYFTMLAVFTLLLIVTDYMTSYELLSAPFYPAFGMIVMGEIYAFLSGMTYEEKREKANEPDDEDDEPEVDYDTLVEKYEELFGSRITLTTHTKALPDVSKSAGELLDKYKKEYDDTLCQEAGVLYAYYSALAQTGKVLDEAYLRQTRNLLDGKSVIFLTKFYTDTNDYVFLPVCRALMQKKRILVVVGGGGNVDSVSKWFSDGIQGITGFDRIWKIAPLAEADDSSSIILFEAKNIYNQKLLHEKSKILAETSMVFLLEASSMLGTLQMGLSCLVTYLCRGGNDPQYVIYDRNCDGLVDSLSHVLNKSLVQVNATSIGTARKNAIFWQADGKLLHHRLGLNNARYLGMGTELALVALKEKVSKVVWAASRNFPVTDMGWIASQYYAEICKKAGLKISQNELSEHIEFVSDPQSISKTENSFVVVEDEYNNAFEIARQFSTRGIEQSFVNVISPRYWLREYMADNIEIFKNDPKSIPTVTPDFQRSTGNMVYKMVMRMIEAPVEEREIIDLLDMLGEDTSAVYKSFRKLILKYCFRVSSGSKDENRMGEKLDNAIAIRQSTEVDPVTMRTERRRYYSIGNAEFVDKFLSQLKIVYYIADEGVDKNSYLDSAMYGHVYQKYLPGMLLTIDGKYYQVISMTKNSGIILRRASDHITGRRYYRTLRKYNLNCCESGSSAAAKRTYDNITLEYVEANVTVDTLGYLEMTEYCDIKNAKRVELSNIDQREYRAKECLKIRMEGSTPEVRATIATLLNELFVTTFPEAHQYITATTKLESGKVIDGYMPALEGVDDDCIYIIEDSLIDLGLLINVERYFVRFLEIICDVLDWHAEKIKNEESKAPADTKENKKSANRSTRINADMTANGNLIDKNETPEDEVEVEDIEYINEGNDDNPGAPDDEKLSYAKSHFLLYGDKEVPKIFDLEKTEDYLKAKFGNNYLKQARESRKPKKQKYYNYVFEEGKHYCDFCGREIEGEPNVLPDGRESCPECSSTAVLKAKDFKKLYKKTRKEIESIFGIKIKSRLSIKVWDAHQIAAAFNETFTPTPKCDWRYLGFAIRNTNPAVIALESGAPELEIAKTLIHEMTHVWQYENIKDIFEPVKDKNAVEGMAVWAEVQYLVSKGLKERAEEYATARSYESSEYGIGFLMYRDKFPIQDKPEVHSGTPFNCKKNPLR